MVKYPNLKKPNTGHKSSNGKHFTAYRGMNLEEDLNRSNRYYLETDRAVIYKKPTPIQIVKVDYPRRAAAKIVEAYFQKPSTTDYNGIYRGCYVDFEAKETRVDHFPFQNISDHQVLHLERILRHGGIAFLIIAFTSIEEVYLLDASYFCERYHHSEKKSLSYDAIAKHGHLIPQGYAPRLNYLDILDTYYFKDQTS